MRVTRINAREAPRKIGKGLLYYVTSVNTASWVLSPSSTGKACQKPLEKVLSPFNNTSTFFNIKER